MRAGSSLAPSRKICINFILEFLFFNHLNQVFEILRAVMMPCSFKFCDSNRLKFDCNVLFLSAYRHSTVTAMFIFWTISVRKLHNLFPVWHDCKEIKIYLHTFYASWLNKTDFIKSRIRRKINAVHGRPKAFFDWIIWSPACSNNSFIFSVA